MLGSRSAIHEAVSTVFPGTDWTDPPWGIWETLSGSIEFNLGSAEPAHGLMLHVRAGDEVVPLIVQLRLQNSWQGLDCSTGEFIEQSIDPTSGQARWSHFRDQVLQGKGNPD